ncbi:related to RRP8 - nucleolar protein required for efficient processing of pre-rRNA at site A2 [Ustilago trichophora]|uniref:Ribosomal RNA-processing protein 8 n=1 Tax=Ustilago trichophora TaxID=86804 RepID=A0A5C3E2G8_9BASI|nr:related to RRP8 - nucleolar protein required for efficient processing of pre-rRNA at site A2 [Ustilago trichophora]
MSGLDLDQLQAQLELKRSALADSILSKLPGLGASSSSESVPTSTNTRPRQANLGVGATPKQTASETSSNGKPRSAADLRLKGALTSKRKRWQDDEPKPQAESDSDDDVGRADTITKKAKQANGSATASGSAGKDAKAAKKDPFAVKGIEAQKAAQSQPKIVIVDGETIDLSKLSKTQRKKINKQLRAQQQSSTNTTDNDDQAKPTTTSTPASPAKASTSTTSPIKIAAHPSTSNTGSGALTALQAQMLSKLSGSRFRTINEKLYTTASEEAVRMIDAAPAMFDEYHQGFREQVRSWPKNPLDRIAALFDASSTSAAPTKGKGKSQASSTGGTVSKFTKVAKARFNPAPLVIDLGAGEGGLAKKLCPKGVKVLCYDLVTTKDGWVRKQDTAAIGGLPLPGYFDDSDPLGLQIQPDGMAQGVADVAVFCLSLMGTNWIHMLLEAKRVLRIGGELIIAEVSSRFENGFDSFIQIVQMLGFGLEYKDQSNSHFVLFEFTKLSYSQHISSLSNSSPDGSSIGMNPHGATLDQLATYGKMLLKPCIYKRR